jgi:hypothetical protein
MFIMPAEANVKVGRNRRPPVHRLVKIADGMAAAKSTTKAKYAINITKEIDPYLRSGYCHLILYRTPDREAGKMDLRASLAKSGAKDVSRRLFFKHVDRGGSMLGDGHPRYLEPLGLNDLDAFKFVDAVLVGDVYHFKLVPYHDDCGLITTDPVLKVSAPKLSNRRESVALAQLVTRTAQSDYQAYHYRVMSMLDSCEKQFGHLFGNQELRYHPEVARDHIFSIRDAFDEGVQEQVVAHWSNMRYLSRSDNSSKNARSDKSIYELYMGYGEGNPLAMARAFKLMDERKR